MKNRLQVFPRKTWTYSLWERHWTRMASLSWYAAYLCVGCAIGLVIRTEWPGSILCMGSACLHLVLVGACRKNAAKAARASRKERL